MPENHFFCIIFAWNCHIMPGNYGKKRYQWKATEESWQE